MSYILRFCIRKTIILKSKKKPFWWIFFRDWSLPCFNVFALSLLKAMIHCSLGIIQTWGQTGVVPDFMQGPFWLICPDKSQDAQHKVAESNSIPTPAQNSHNCNAWENRHRFISVSLCQKALWCDKNNTVLCGASQKAQALKCCVAWVTHFICEGTTV